MKEHFENDMLGFFCKYLTELGYQLPANQSLHTMTIRYFNVIRRLIPTQPRIVYFACDFITPKEYENALDILKVKFEHGENVNPHLSTTLLKVDFFDDLLNDWGIHHFHLGTVIDKRGFIKRTGPLLFAKVTNQAAYFLKIGQHDGLSEKKLLDTIHDNWPDIIAHYQVKGVLPSNQQMTDEDIRILRKAGITPITQRTDGTIHVAPGGGITLSGNSTLSTRKAINVMNWIRALKKDIAAKFITLQMKAQQAGFNFNDEAEFGLILERDRILLIETTSGWKCSLCVFNDLLT
jgi:hypothetical protein